MTPQTSKSSCSICAQSAWQEKVYAGNDYVSRDIFPFQACQICNSFTTFLPPATRIANYYGEKYYRDEKGKFIPGVNQLFLYQHQRAARKIYQQWNEPQIVVDIGCGQGVLMDSLSQLGATTYGVEHDEASSWVLENPRINVETHSKFFAGTGKQLAGKVDLVIFWHVLEHMEDPLACLRDAHHLLSSTGRLCISVPNISSLQARLSYTNWFHLDVPRHLYHFSPDALKLLLQRGKFRLVKIESGDWYQNLFGWFQSLANVFSSLWSGKCDNSIYRIMQNQLPDSFSAFVSLLIQLLTAPLWILLGLLGFILEMISGNHGTMTVYAEKEAKSS